MSLMMSTTWNCRRQLSGSSDVALHPPAVQAYDDWV